jgi:hypothetical protein
MPAHDASSGGTPGGEASTAPTEGSAEATIADPNADGPLSKIAAFVVNIGSPLALITALMFYFGWVRTQVQARQLGYDVAVLQLSTTDYLLKSINVLFPVIAAALVAVIIGFVAYSAAVERVRQRGDAAAVARRAYRATGIAAVAALLLGAVFYAIPLTQFAAIPVALTAAILFVIARGKLRPLVGKRPWSTTSQVLALVLLALLLFWDTERIARVLGEQFAYDIAAYPEQFPEVVVYSQNELNIEAEGVEEEVLSAAEGGYRFRHTGLRLMEQTGEKYVLINELWYGGRGRIVVLEDSDDVRFEFVDRY